MSVKGFEEITHELRGNEISIVLPLLTEMLQKHVGKANAISNSTLRQYLFDQHKITISDSRIRKVIEVIRHSFAVENVVAGARGYFVAQTPDELQEWLTSVRQRRNAITTIITAGERSLRKMTGHKQPNQHKRRKLDLSIVQSNLL